MGTKLGITSEESFAILKEIESQEWDRKRNYLDWREQKDKDRNEAIKNLIPCVGLGCTICYYSDKRAATVTKVLSPCKIEVTFNQTKCIDYYAGDYEILPELEGAPQVFTKRKNGYWVAEGQKYKDGVLLMLHYQSHYIDPSY
ncbi:hypothetical protein [Parabacteroides merdae]|uniref:hypothetical protein n=1 Tax=Parabacteroides merdae TaxID=46503 RepID=UPI0034A1FA32